MSNIIYTDVAKITTYEHYYYHSGGVRSFFLSFWFFLSSRSGPNSIESTQDTSVIEYHVVNYQEKGKKKIKSCNLCQEVLVNIWKAWAATLADTSWVWMIFWNYGAANLEYTSTDACSMFIYILGLIKSYVFIWKKNKNKTLITSW